VREFGGFEDKLIELCELFEFLVDLLIGSSSFSY
jgi:hypothetical protein